MGPNPIARSSTANGWHEWFNTSHLLPAKMLYDMATSPSGKARVCKTLIMGSNPIVASSVQRPSLSPKTHPGGFRVRFAFIGVQWLTPTIPNLISIQEAARKYGMAETRLRSMIEHCKIKAAKVMGELVVPLHKEDLPEYNDTLNPLFVNAHRQAFRSEIGHFAHGWHPRYR